MSLSGIIAGACAVLTATSTFDDVNLSWMDPGVLDTSPCRWAGMFTLENVDPARMVYGATTSYGYTWGVTLRTWIKYNKASFATWQSDHMTVVQDIIDAISGSDTLNDSCEDANIILQTAEPVEVNKRAVTEMTWLLTAEEYDR